MSQGRKLKILENIFGSHYQSKDEIIFSCPKCEHHKKKLSINIEKNVFKCWVCDYSGNSLRRLVRAYGNFKHRAEWAKITNVVDISSFEDKLFPTEDAIEEQIVSLPEEYISLVNKDLPYSSLYARNYLKERGITREDICKWKIGYCDAGPYKGRIIIPSFNMSGRCNYFIARTYLDSWKKYMNPPASRDIIFNQLYVNFDEDIILVEGVFDAIVADLNSIPLLGSTLREDSRLFQEIVKNDSPVYIALDPDAEKKATRLIDKLLYYGIQVYKIDISPFADAGEMSKEEFLKRKNKAEIINKDNYLLRQIMKI